jgi:hypothetical protein
VFEQYVATKTDVGTIRQTLEQLWVLRSPHETAKTAVVQLFGSLPRYREGFEYRHLACTTSIAMLVAKASDSEQALAFSDVL